MNTTDLSPLSASGVVTRRALSPAVEFSRGVGTPTKPPRGIYIPQGPISDVRVGNILPPSSGRTTAQRMGIAFEIRVQDVLSAIYGDQFFCNVPILFEDRRGLHRCIPDGVLRLSPSSIAIIEIKLRHTERAYWQLEKLYKPVLRKMVTPGSRVYTVEICRSYDPDEVWPGVHEVVKSLHRLSLDRTGVLQWQI